MTEREPERPAADIRRRLFVAIATSEYEFGWEPLDEVRDEVEVIRDWLCDEGLSERRFEHAYPALAENPDLGLIESALKRRPREAWRDTDAVVLLVAGHGEKEEGEHYAILRDSEPDALPITALSTRNLLGWLATSNVEHLLLIVDACFAGAIRDFLPQVRQLPQTWAILPSALTSQTSTLGAFPEAIAGFLLDLKEKKGLKYHTHAYLNVAEFVGFINERLPLGQRVGALPESGNWRIPHICLPNPIHVPKMELAFPRRDIKEHWGPRGRGVEGSEESGWLFTDREALMRALIAHATDPRPGSTVVTGAAGSGKSAALARLVTLSDPAFRAEYRTQVSSIPSELMPPDEAVDVAVVATGKIRSEVLAQIMQACGLPSPTADAIDRSLERNLRQWHGWLATTAKPITIVVDALDEADAPVELLRLLAQLDPDPLNRKIRLIVGVRSPRVERESVARAAPEDLTLEGIAEEQLSAAVIRVDQPPYWQRRDHVRYVERILRETAGSPYVDIEVSALASRISSWAGRSYLLARHAARWLVGVGTPLAFDDVRVQAALSDDLVSLLRAELELLDGRPGERLRRITLLRAIAFGRGRGMPWHRIWPRVASAMDSESEREYGDEAIVALLRSSLGGYLSVDRDAELPTYRLFHNELRDTLRRNWRRLLPDPPPADAGTAATSAEIQAIERGIVRVLWQLAEPALDRDSRLPLRTYVRRYFAEHAAAAGQLDDDHVPARFLPYVDPWRLRIAARDAGGDAKIRMPLLPVIRQVTHLWRWDQPAYNAAAIQMWAALNGIIGTPAGISPWKVRWAIGPEDNGVVVDRRKTEIWAAITTVLPGRGAVAIVGGGTRPVMWPLEAAETDAEAVPLTGLDQEGTIETLATARLRDGRRVVVAGGGDGSVRVWDLTTRHPIGTPMRGDSTKVTSIATAVLPDHTVVAVTGHADGIAWLWNLDLRTLLGSMSGHTGAVSALTTAELADGTVVAVTGGADLTVRVWNLATREPRGGILRGHTGTVSAVAVARLKDRTVAISGARDAEARVKDRTLRIWDLGAEQRHGFLHTDSGILSMTTAVLADQRTVAITGGEDAVIRILDLTAGVEICEPFRGHSGTVTAVAVAETVGGQVVISAGNDRTVRTWDLTSLPVNRPGERVGTVEAVETALLPGLRPVVLAARADNVVEARDLESGATIGRSYGGAASAVLAITAAVLADDRHIVVAGTWDAAIHAWDGTSGDPLGPPLRGHRGPVTSVDVLPGADRGALLITGGWDAVRVWDLTTGTQHEPLPDVAPHAVATGRLADGTVVVAVGHADGTIALWDLAGRRRTGRRLRHLSGAVTAVRIFTMPDGRVTLVAGDDRGSVRVTDLADGSPIGRPIRCHRDGVTALAVMPLPDGRAAVLTCDLEPAIQCWDLVTGVVLCAPLPTPHPVRAIAPPTDGRSPRGVIAGNGLAAFSPADGFM